MIELNLVESSFYQLSILEVFDRIIAQNDGVWRPFQQFGVACTLVLRVDYHYLRDDCVLLAVMQLTDILIADIEFQVSAQPQVGNEQGNDFSIGIEFWVFRALIHQSFDMQLVQELWRVRVDVALIFNQNRADASGFIEERCSGHILSLLAKDLTQQVHQLRHFD